MLCYSNRQKIHRSKECGMPSTTSVLDNPVDGWVTLKEAGEIVNRDISTIRYWVNNNKLACYRIGTSSVRIVNIEEVKEYSVKHSYRLHRTKRKKRKSSKK